MRAMVLESPGKGLQEKNYPTPQPAAGQILVKVKACGVCRTDLHVVDGELPNPKLPIIPGHEIVGVVEKIGEDASNFEIGQKVGIPWLGSTCGHCQYCREGNENLCDSAVFTGYLADGGYAEYALADSRYCFPVPESYSEIQAAPLLCAGLIGWRALKLAGEGKKLGLYGFGASAHIVIQIARHQGRRTFAFTRPGDAEGQVFARTLGAEWAGGSDELPPESLDAAIIFAPVGALVPAALKAIRKGGIVVCAGIHMSDIPSFPYEILWGERIVRSVANLTRQDGREFFEIAPKIPIRTTVEIYPLIKANEALSDLRSGKTVGAAVLVSS